MSDILTVDMLTPFSCDRRHNERMHAHSFQLTSTGSVCCTSKHTVRFGTVQLNRQRWLTDSVSSYHKLAIQPTDNINARMQWLGDRSNMKEGRPVSEAFLLADNHLSDVRGTSTRFDNLHEPLT